MEHMIAPFVNPGMFEGKDILGLFNNTNLALVTVFTAADRAGVRVGDIKAGRTQGNFPFY